MSVFSLDIARLRRELTAFPKWAAGFLEPGSQANFDRFVRSLDAALDARDGGNFKWPRDDLGEGGVVGLMPSRSWKGVGAHKELGARVSFQWICTRDPTDATRLLVRSGAAELRFTDSEDQDADKVLHFDVCAGGINGQVGHPPLHVQFLGTINDVPRLPMFIGHPLDVLDFAILELNQGTWRRHLTEARTKSLMGPFPTRQRARIAATLRFWTGLLEAPRAGHAFQEFQKPSRIPLAYG